jgi:hypothetical protein
MNYHPFELKWEQIPMALLAYRTEKRVLSIKYTAELFGLDGGGWILHRYESDVKLPNRKFESFSEAKAYAARWIREEYEVLMY